MLRRLRIQDGRLVEADEGNGQVLVYVNPDEPERRYLLDVLKIDEHTLSSAMDPDELGRLEFEPEHLAIIYKRPKNYSSADEFVFHVWSTGLFLFKDRLVVVMAEEAALFEGKQFTRLLSVADVMLRLINRSIAHFVEHLRVINAVSNSLEQQINHSMENRYLYNMFTLEKSLVYYLNGINSNAKVIERLKINVAKLGFTPEQQDLLDDMTIENSQCYEQAEVYSNILSSLMDARASIVGNNLNRLMKTLNVLTLGIMLPTLVVSAFSMNVEFPGRNDPHAFYYILSMAACSAVALALVWWYKKW